MEFKHFSHTHGLVPHQPPQGSEVTCSGCKSPASGEVHVCWKCNYFLHGQCFRASRSIRHPSHPLHPLTLVPSPTYPSGSFICNTCHVSSDGFSYSCSACEFDIHVSCALLNIASNPLVPHTPAANPNFHNPIYPPPPAQASPYPPPPIQAGLYPTTYPPHQHPTIPAYAQHYPPHQQHTIPADSQHYPPHQHPTIPAVAQHYPPHQPPNTVYPPIPNSPYPDFPQNAAQNYGGHQNPTFPQPPPANNPVTANPPPPQPNSTVPTYSTAGNETTATTPHPKPLTMIKHFSHPHALKPMEIEQKNAKVCSACEYELSGSAYYCTESHCTFNLHKACFESSRELRHKSHLQHPLTLLAKPPYSDGFTCNACLKDGNAFVYTCGICSYDLHIDCAQWPEAVKRPDHKHNLALYYSSPAAETTQDVTFMCDVCKNPAHEMAWVYYCRECDFGTHLECVTTGIKQQGGDSAGKSDEDLITETELKFAVLQLLLEAQGRKAALKLI